jgi:branched-chain amino acid aminotransferase
MELIPGQKIWLNGKFIDWDTGKIHILTHSFHYGSSVFEGIRAYRTDKGPAVFRLPDHIKRLFYSASSLGINIPFSEEKINQVILELININKMEECYIRPIVFLGYGGMGLNANDLPINIAVTSWPWKAYLSEKPTITVKISKFIKIHPKSTIIDAKISGHYANSILASLEVRKKGFDEALLLDFEGYIAEGPAENIFFVKNNNIITPSPGSILPGITRDSVMQIAKDLGIKVEERKVILEEIKSMDEAFFTGTAVEIHSISKIDETLIGQGTVGIITKKIKDVFQKIIKGEEEKYLNWLTFIEE